VPATDSSSPAAKTSDKAKASRGASFTVVGVTYVLISLLVGLAALNSQANLLYLMFGLAMGGLLVSGVLSSRMNRSCQLLARQIHSQVVVGRPFTIRYLLRNRRAWGRAYSLHVEEKATTPQLTAAPEVFVPSIPADSTVEAEVTALAKQRGHFRLGALRLSTRFPFRLLTRYQTYTLSQEVVVLPALGRLHRDLLAEVSDGAVRRRRRRQWISSSEEYSGVREYRPGDNPRLIHWHRSARTGQLIIRETSRHRPDRLMIVLDLTTNADDPLRHQSIESIVSCAATLACEGLERGFHVGLVVNAEPLVVLGPAGGWRHRPRILTALAKLPNETDLPLAESLQRTRWPVAWRGRCVVMATTPSKSLHNSIRYLAERAGRTVSVVASDPKFADWFEPPECIRNPGKVGR
jgi:uncharacterized protein (DUF58 family)